VRNTSRDQAALARWIGAEQGICLREKRNL
jgi:hypothetical protein